MFRPLSIIACMALATALLAGPAAAQGANAEIAEYQRVCAAERQARAATFAPGFNYAEAADTSSDRYTIRDLNVPRNLWHHNISAGVVAYLWRDNQFDASTLEVLASGADFEVRQCGRLPCEWQRLMACALRVRAQQLRRSGGARPTTSAAAPPTTATAAIAPRTTTPPPTASPPQRVLTAAEQEAIRAARERRDRSQRLYAECRSGGWQYFCTFFDRVAFEDQANYNSINFRPSAPPPLRITPADRRQQFEAALAEARSCLSRQTSSNLEAARVACEPTVHDINGQPTVSPPQALDRQIASTPVATPAPPPAQAAEQARPEVPARAQVRSRVVAGSGRDAMDCVVMVQFAESDARLSGENRMVINRCEERVEVFWCYLAGPFGDDCNKSGAIGNTMDIRPGNRWPLSANGEIRWGACRGINSGGFEDGQAGLRFICRGPPYASGGPVSRSSSTESEAPTR